MPSNRHTPLTSIGKVLFVEDDELFVLNLKNKLKRFHIECDWFQEYQSAVEALRTIDYHAVVSDMYLKSDRPNGLEIVKLAKKLGIPSVIITSRLDLVIAKQGLNDGADALLEKPFEVDELVKVLQEIWENPSGMIGRRERYFEINALTPKEKELGRLVIKGLSNQEIATVSGTTLATVKFYTNQIFEKCGVHSRAELFNTMFPT